MNHSIPERYHAAHARPEAEPEVVEVEQTTEAAVAEPVQAEDAQKKKRPLWLRAIIKVVRLILALAFVSIAIKATGLTFT